MTSGFAIGGRAIGPGKPTYVIAEMSANHGQDFQHAVRIVEAAAAAGADAVKLQTYTADTLTLASQQDCFRISSGTIWDGRTLHDLYQEASTPWDWQPRLKDIGERLGMHVFSSPFDHSAVEFLSALDVPAYKIASFELVDIPLIRRVAREGKPVIMSTGMATLAEIDEAVRTARESGARDLVLLKCTSGYPASPDEMNLRTIPHLADAFGESAGLSDHTLGTAVPVAAVTLGATVIEKHLTISRSDPGPDSAFSLEPHEFRAMVDMIRVAERALGSVHYGVSDAEAKTRIFRRSLFVTEDVAAGELFTTANVRSIRPADGLHTRHLGEVLSRKAAKDIVKGTPLAWELVE